MGWARNIPTAEVWFAVKHVDLGADKNPPTNQQKCHHAFPTSRGKQLCDEGVDGWRAAKHTLLEWELINYAEINLVQLLSQFGSEMIFTI